MKSIDSLLEQLEGLTWQWGFGKEHSGIPFIRAEHCGNIFEVNGKTRLLAVSRVDGIHVFTSDIISEWASFFYLKKVAEFERDLLENILSSKQS